MYGERTTPLPPAPVPSSLTPAPSTGRVMESSERSAFSSYVVGSCV